MLTRETNDLNKVIEEAKGKGCAIIRTANCGDKTFVFITDAVGLLVASEDGHIEIPLEEMPTFVDSLKQSALKSIEWADQYTMADKNEIARIRNLTYGEYKGKMYQAANYCSRVGLL